MYTYTISTPDGEDEWISTDRISAVRHYLLSHGVGRWMCSTTGMSQVKDRESSVIFLRSGLA